MAAALSRRRWRRSGSGRRPFARLDVLHRENLEAVLPEFEIDPASVPPSELDALNLAWHRLDPWPDSVPGLTRLKRRFIVAPLSNGNIRLMLDMAKRAGLPWDAILGAELAHAYKPSPKAYLRTAEALMLKPEQVCLVAAHNSDLAAARGCGLRTAFISRPNGAWAGSDNRSRAGRGLGRLRTQRGGFCKSARPLIVAIGCTRTVANPAAELEIQPPSTAANRRESKRLPITAAACKRGRACRASRSTRAVSRLCTLTGSAVATASWSNSTFLSPARRTPRSVRKLTISSANRGFPSDLSMTRCARASGRTSTSSRAWISCRISLADSGSNPSPVTIGRSPWGSIQGAGIAGLALTGDWVW